MCKHQVRLCVIQRSRSHKLYPSGAHSHHTYIIIIVYVPYVGSIWTNPIWSARIGGIPYEVIGKDISVQGKLLSLWIMSRKLEIAELGFTKGKES